MQWYVPLWRNSCRTIPIFAVVLAYLPTKKLAYPFPSLLPDGIEAAPKRFAISYRNKWMLKQSHFVVTYITHDWGGAAQFASLAKKQKKTVLNLTK